MASEEENSAAGGEDYGVVLVWELERGVLGVRCLATVVGAAHAVWRAMAALCLVAVVGAAHGVWWVVVALSS